MFLFILPILCATVVMYFIFICYFPQKTLLYSYLNRKFLKIFKNEKNAFFFTHILMSFDILYSLINPSVHLGCLPFAWRTSFVKTFFFFLKEMSSCFFETFLPSHWVQTKSIGFLPQTLKMLFYSSQVSDVILESILTLVLLYVMTFSFIAFKNLYWSLFFGSLIMMCLLGFYWGVYLFQFVEFLGYMWL